MTLTNRPLSITGLLMSMLPVILVKGIEPILPFGDINVVVLTDVHTWVGGHVRQEPSLDVDFGDVLSFWERLKAHCDENGMDLWFVNNGDWVHGTGLSANGDTSSLVPILEKMPWDAVNCGNHELYEEPIVNYMMRPGGFVDWWGDRYVTANVVKAKEGDKPLGRRYKVLEGKNSNLLVFGFLYNLKNPCDLIHVHPVEAVVKEPWFLNALTLENYDAILVLAHMDLVDPLVNVILDAIRQAVGDDMPVQFITGHTHYRGLEQLDPMSSTVEFGRYLDTVGFVSFPTAQSATDESKRRFESEFVDANKQQLRYTLALNMNEDLSTKNGQALNDFISNTQRKKGLLEEIGCAPRNYVVNASLEDPGSLWGLYRDEVIPQLFFSREDTEDVGSIMFLSKESWRYDIFSTSSLVVDDIWAVAPFNDTVTYMGTFEGSVIRQLNESMNADIDPWLGVLPNYIQIGKVDEKSSKAYALYTHDYNAHSVKDALERINPDEEITPEITDYSSTLLWLSFVMENWACDGLLGQLPDWFPKPDHLASKLGKNGDDMEKGVLIGVLVILALIALVCAMCCWMWLRYLCYWNHHSVSQEELDAFSLDDDIVDEDPSENKTMDMTLSDDDHEML